MVIEQTIMPGQPVCLPKVSADLDSQADSDDHNSDADVEFSDIRGFARSSPLCRQPNAHKGCPDGGSEAEYLRVIASGGKFINQIGILGKNVKGEENLTVLPMASGERLISVNPGRCASTSAAVIGVAKELSMMHGGHDVAKFAAWQADDGTVLPPISEKLIADCPMAHSLFCDNVTVYSLKHKPESKVKFNGSGEKSDDSTTIIEKPSSINAGPSEKISSDAQHPSNSAKPLLLSEQNGREHVFQFMTSLGFKVQRGQQTEDQDRSKRFFVSLCRTARDSKYYKWKISLADVPIESVELVCDMLKQAETNCYAEMAPPGLYEQFKTKYSAAMMNLGITPGKFQVTFESAQKLLFCDIDLTYDLPGTLNSIAFAQAVVTQGLEVDEASKCGINCVKTKQFKFGTVNAVFKAYNKLAETMQQGSARSNEIDCKTAYLLNPSTKHLQEVLRTPDYNQNGITRYEATLSGISGQIPAFRQMYDIMAKYKGLFNPSTLVTCSVQNHIKLMELHVNRSIVVYFPDMFDFKKKEWLGRTCKKRDNVNKLLKQNLNEIPDAVLIRYNNTSTGKFNGHLIKSQFAGRADRDVSGWDLTAKSLAWATSCKQNPILFVCVAGSLQASAKESRIVNMYFRQVEIERTGPSFEMATYLPWHCGFERGNQKNSSTDWSFVGVDRISLENLKFQCIARDVKPSYQTMGTLDIKISGDSTEEEVFSHASSDTREAISGLTNRYYEVSKHNGALETWVNWEKYKVCELGRAKTKKLRFLVGGDWFWIPVGKESTEIMEYLEKNDTAEKQTIASVRMVGNNLEWRVSETGHKIQGGRCKGARSFPVDSEPVQIEGGGLQTTGTGEPSLFVCTKFGKHYLPQSIREQLQRYVKDKKIVASICNFVSTLQILHPESSFGRVPNMKNAEEYMSILDSAGNTIASNMDGGAKRRRVE